MSAIGALNPGRSRNRRVPSPGAVAPDNRRSDADESGWLWWSAPRFRALLPLPGNPYHPVRYRLQRWPYLLSTIEGWRLRTLERESKGSGNRFFVSKIQSLPILFQSEVL